MPRHNSTNRKNVAVTREVYALATLAAHRAGEGQEEPGYLPGRVMGSRRITRRMLKALRAQAV